MGESKNKVNLDSRNRIPLTKVLHTHACSAKTFNIYWEGERIILEPLVEIPEREMWIYKNKKTLASLERGIKDAGNGKTRKLNLDELPETDDDQI